MNHRIARSDVHINLFFSNTADVIDFEYEVISHSKIHNQSIIRLIASFTLIVISLNKFIHYVP